MNKFDDGATSGCRTAYRSVAGRKGGWSAAGRKAVVSDVEERNIRSKFEEFSPAISGAGWHCGRVELFYPGHDVEPSPIWIKVVERDWVFHHIGGKGVPPIITTHHI